MRVESAISLIAVVMEALVHREICLKSAKKEVPGDLLTAALLELEAHGKDMSEARGWLLRHGVKLAQSAQPAYHRRSNNQVPGELEALIRELLDKNWSKSAIAKHLKINRRVVIRVAREAQSAQNGRSRPLR